jgi:hypothetical protein
MWPLPALIASIAAISPDDCTSGNAVVRLAAGAVSAFSVVVLARPVARTQIVSRAFRAKGNHQPARGQACPNIKGGLDDRTIARVAEQSSGASNHLAIQTSP